MSHTSSGGDSSGSIKLELPKELLYELDIWDLVNRGQSLLEIETSWTILDVYKANQVYSAHIKAENKAREKANSK